jgi:hypothetical protein
MKAKLMRHKAFLEFVALLVVLLQTVHGREWLGELADGHVLEQHSKGSQQQQQHQQESVFWQRRVQQLDPGALSRAGRSTTPPLVPPVPAAGGSGEPGDMHMQLHAACWHSHDGHQANPASSSVNETVLGPHPP